MKPATIPGNMVCLCLVLCNSVSLHYKVQLSPGTSVISFLLPKAEVKLELRVIIMISHEQQVFKWLLFQCTIYNQIPIIKLSASGTTQDMIDYFCEIHLKLFLQQQSCSTNSLCSRLSVALIFCLGIILTVVELVSEKQCRAATINKECPASGKKQVDILISKNQALQILYLKHHA